MIVVDADGLFSGMLRRTLQETLIIPVHAVARGNQEAIINEGFHRYLNKVQKINWSDKGSLHQWLQGVLFEMYSWNSGPVDWTYIAWSVVAIGREFPFPFELSPARLKEGTLEVKQALYHFEAASPLMFIQRELFNILVYERSLRHSDLRFKVSIMREFDTWDLLILRRQVKSSRKYRIDHKLVFKTKGNIQSPREGYTNLVLASAFAFWWGSREALNKSEGISVQVEKDTIHHGVS